MEINNNLTDAEKLNKIKTIIENNLYSVFSSFALDFDDNYSKGNLKDYVELKKLLNIDIGEINIEQAKNYDNFKETQKDLYDILITKLDDRMIELRDKYQVNRLSEKMFMAIVYPIFIHNISTNMSIQDFDKMINEIDEYYFTSG